VDHSQNPIRQYDLILAAPSRARIGLLEVSAKLLPKVNEGWCMVPRRKLIGNAENPLGAMI
jgi:hypothetical protein